VDLVQAAAKPVVICGAGLRKNEADLLRKVEPRPIHSAGARRQHRHGGGAGLIDRIDPTAAAPCSSPRPMKRRLGEVAAQIGRSAFVIVMACYASPLTERADLVLPMATWLERSGGFTTRMGPASRHAALRLPVSRARIGTSWTLGRKTRVDARAPRPNYPVRRLKGERTCRRY